MKAMSDDDGMSIRGTSFVIVGQFHVRVGQTAGDLRENLQRGDQDRVHVRRQWRPGSGGFASAIGPLNRRWFIRSVGAGPPNV